jgi:hypothetical protein
MHAEGGGDGAGAEAEEEEEGGAGDEAVRQEACDVRALALFGLSAGMGNGGSYLKVLRLSLHCIS